MQNRAVRLIKHLSKFNHVSEYYRQLRWLPFKKLVQLATFNSFDVLPITITTLNVFCYCLQLSLGRITHIMILGLLPTLQTQKDSALHFHKTFLLYITACACFAVVEQFSYLLYFTLLLKTNV